MPAPHRPPSTPRSAPPPADLEALHTALDALPAPLEPLDPMALDGYLCGVLLQPRRPAPASWLPGVIDIEGRAAPAGLALDELQAQVQRRLDELDFAIAQRQWFDPWVFEPEDGEVSPAQAVLPWVAGFAAAMERFPELMGNDDPALVEPLALLYRHFEPEDLEDADALLEVIETLEPPQDLAEAVEDLVRSVMLIADVTRPRPVAARRPAPRGRPPARGGPPARGRR